MGGDSLGRKAGLDALARRFGDRFDRRLDILRAHANTLTVIASQPPDAVVWPLDTAEVQEIMRLASEAGLPIVPFGAGTSLEGHVNAPLGGVCVDLSRMKRIIAVNAEDCDCVVEAGVTRLDLNQHVRDTGLFFPVDPGAGDATLGGMASTRASGTAAVLYGTMRDAVMGVTAVMADGSVVSAGGRARKSAAGYDLTSLFVGSEGTLGIITELTLKLHPRPAEIMVAVVAFGDLEAACQVTIETLGAGVTPARIELLDEHLIRAVNLNSKLSLRETPTLFVEFHGATATQVAESVAVFREIAARHGAIGFESAEAPEARTRLWQARHDAFWAVRSTWPGKTVVVSDVAVPISKLAQCVTETALDIAESGLTAPIVGHVGDGNFHAVPVFDGDDPDQVRRVEAFLARLVDRALAFGGTSTGEHGVGQGKIGSLLKERGPAAVALMKAIKRAADPGNILNPGKIFI